MGGFIDPDIDESKPTFTLRTPKHGVCPSVMLTNRHSARNKANAELLNVIVSFTLLHNSIIKYQCLHPFKRGESKVPLSVFVASAFFLADLFRPPASTPRRSRSASCSSMNTPRGQPAPVAAARRLHPAAGTARLRTLVSGRGRPDEKYFGSNGLQVAFGLWLLLSLYCRPTERESNHNDFCGVFDRITISVPLKSASPD